MVYTTNIFFSVDFIHQYYIILTSLRRYLARPATKCPYYTLNSTASLKHSTTLLPSSQRHCYPVVKDGLTLYYMESMEAP